MKEKILWWVMMAMRAKGHKRPYFHLTGYMRRWWVIGGSYSDSRPRAERGWRRGVFDFLFGWLFFAMRLHKLESSDNDRHMHDHPAWSISIILWGGYYELMPACQDQPPHLDATYFNCRWRGPGAIVIRRKHCRHQLKLNDGQPSWSLFIRGRTPRNWQWGFYRPEGKVPAKTYFNMQKAAKRSEANHEL